jgi:hypothetical protein
VCNELLWFIHNEQNSIRYKFARRPCRVIVSNVNCQSRFCQLCMNLNRCPVLLITGQKSVFNATTRSVHQAILKNCSDKGKVEFIEVAGVANILEEKVGTKSALVWNFHDFWKTCTILYHELFRTLFQNPAHILRQIILSPVFFTAIGCSFRTLQNSKTLWRICDSWCAKKAFILIN